MSQTKNVSADRSTTTRVAFDGSPKQGSGDNKRIYVGKGTSYNYDGYIHFLLDSAFWLGVGKIVSAVLTTYTDDAFGTQGQFVDQDGTPKATVRRLTSAFSEHTGSETFDTDDYTAPTVTTSGGGLKAGTAAALGVNNWDVTDIVEAWAPVTVKKRSGAAGGAATNHGFALLGTSTASERFACVSEDAEPGLAAYEPVLTLTYDYGLTAPDVPTNLSPSGAQTTLDAFEGDFSDVKTTDQLRKSGVEVYTNPAAGTAAAVGNAITSAGHGLPNGAIIYFTSLTGGVGLSTFTAYYVVQRTTTTFKVSLTSGGSEVDITTNYTALAWAKRLYSKTLDEGNAAIVAARFSHVTSGLVLLPNVTYRWRARVTDQEGQVSAYTALTSFSVTNTAPNDPVLSPVSGSSKATLDGVLFKAPFTDPDVGDTLAAYQVQLSAYPEGDAHWDDDEFILWNTGKRPVESGATAWSTPYGGASLAAGTYYWRARHWDNHNTGSGYEYATIILTADFESEPEEAATTIQLRPRAPWRIVIRDMGTNRGPGEIVAILEDALNVGASILYNSPGEAHWTLGIAHPQLSVIEPRQTHYAIEFRQGDGWREVFAGLVIDFDATATDVVFYGVDYLGLLDAMVDEHYDPANPDLPAEKGGSKYVTDLKNTIAYIVTDQLKRAREVANSPVGFISTGSIGAMTEEITVYSTYQPTLNFVVGLLDSHRAGTGKRTRLSVRKTTLGGYQWVVVDDPGTVRENLRFRFGEMVQGYRIIPFGKDWATRIAGIGRDKDGVLVRYKSITAPGIDESVWGRWVRPIFIDGVADANDLSRQVKQAAVAASKLGKQVALGLRSGILQPRDGYDVCDIFPLDIEHGSVSTAAFGSGYWVAVGITFTSSQQGEANTTLTLSPREDAVAPDTDLLTLQPISTQAEWQIGWTDPNPLNASSRLWLDQSTGTVYRRTDGNVLVAVITGSV